MSETDPFLSEEGDGADERTRLEAYFMQSLEMDLLLRACPDDEDTIYQIVDLLVDTCSTKRKLLRVAGDDKPAVRNMKQYLLAALYNAPTTMQLYYQNQTNHDLSNRG